MKIWDKGEIHFKKRLGGWKRKGAAAAGKGTGRGPVFCWSFQSDFTNEMGNIVNPDEPGATASMPMLPKTAVLAVSLCLLIIS